jgi:hypothetical protein
MNREPLEQTLADIADFLNLQGVPFAVIGGIAVAVRGESRFTADVDIVLGIDLEQSLALLAAVRESPFRPLFSDVEEIVQASFLLPLRHQESGIKVDLAIGVTGFEQQMIARSTPVQLADRLVPIVSAEDLILMKLLASRPRDIADIDGIVEYQGDGLDWKYLLQTGRELTEAIDQDLVSTINKLRPQ